MTEAVSYIISASSAPAAPANIMVVDDDRIMLMMLTQALEQLGHKVFAVRSGEEALNLMSEKYSYIDTIILDREMPVMNGLEVIKHVKENNDYSDIPIIMLTGSGSSDQIQQGIDAGVFYYLVKPATDALLKSVVGSALRERRQRKLITGQINRRDAALRAMHSCQINIQTLAEAEDVACFVACCFPEPERVVTGLLELLINSIEHGNLGITYEQKAELIAKSNWRSEVETRSRLPENSRKYAEVVFQHKPDGYYVQITDSGSGFDWKKYCQIDPSRATAPHGRGIARARLMAFDKLAYNSKGNQVTAVVGKKDNDGFFSW